MTRKEFRLKGEADRSRGDEGQDDLVESPEPVRREVDEVVKQIETSRLPDPIMRRPHADREEKRVTRANEMSADRLPE